MSKQPAARGSLSPVDHTQQPTTATNTTNAATESSLRGITNSLLQAVEDAMVLREEAGPHDGLAAGLVSTLEHVLAEIRRLAVKSCSS